jgi:outer membrane lipoprotein SlyB
LVSLGVLAIPGFESLVAAGPFVAALTGAGAGAIAGGAAGLVIGLQFPEFVALQYDNKMDSGNILISVHTEGGTERTRAKEIFKNPDRVTEAEVVMNSANDRRSIAK